VGEPEYAPRCNISIHGTRLRWRSIKGCYLARIRRNAFAPLCLVLFAFINADNVCFWHLADIQVPPGNVRFWHKADIKTLLSHVWFLG
jgi:hypothetical protein